MPRRFTNKSTKYIMMLQPGPNGQYNHAGSQFELATGEWLENTPSFWAIINRENGNYKGYIIAGRNTPWPSHQEIFDNQKGYLPYADEWLMAAYLGGTEGSVSLRDGHFFPVDLVIKAPGTNAGSDAISWSNLAGNPDVNVGNVLITDGNAFKFDGTNYIVNRAVPGVGSNAEKSSRGTPGLFRETGNPDYGTNDFSITVDFKADAVGDHMIYAHGEDADNEMHLSVSAGGKAYFVYRKAAAFEVLLDSGSVNGLNDGAYHSIGISRVGDKYSLFVDGALSAFADPSNPHSGGAITPGLSISHSGNPFSKNPQFGSDAGINQMSSTFCNGEIKNFKLWMKTMTDQDIIGEALVPGLMHHWTFDDSHIESINGNNAELQGASFSTAAERSFVSFDGINDSVSIPHSPVFVMSSFSTSVWIKPSSLAGTQRFIGKGITTNNWFSLSLVGSTLQALTWGNSGSPTGVISNGTVSQDVWHHVVLTYDNSTSAVVMYLDGLSVGTVTDATFPGLTNSSSLVLGMNAEGNGEYYSGKVDDTRIYNHALSASEVATLHSTTAQLSDATPVYSKALEAAGDGVSRFGQASFGTTAGQDALIVDGDLDYGTFNVGSASLSNDFTFSMRINANDASAYGALWQATSKTSGHGNGEGILKASQAGIKFVGHGTGWDNMGVIWNAGDPIDPQTTFTSNAWHSLIITKQSNTYKMYFNGALVAERASVGGNQGQAGTWMFGTWGSSNVGFNGSIKDVRFYQQVLTSGQIEQLAAPYVVPPVITVPGGEPAVPIGISRGILDGVSATYNGQDVSQDIVATFFRKLPVGPVEIGTHVDAPNSDIEIIGNNCKPMVQGGYQIRYNVTKDGQAAEMKMADFQSQAYNSNILGMGPNHVVDSTQDLIVNINSHGNQFPAETDVFIALDKGGNDQVFQILDEGANNHTFPASQVPAKANLKLTVGYVPEGATDLSNVIDISGQMDADTEWNNVSLLLTLNSDANDSSQGSNNFVEVGGSLIDSTTSRFGPGSALFSSDDQALQGPADLFGSFAAGTDITIEAWVRPTSNGNAGNTHTHRCIVSKGDDIYMNFGIDNGKLRFYWHDGQQNLVESAGQVPLNEWSHVAVTIDSNNIKLWIRGEHDGSGTFTGISAAHESGPSWIGHTARLPGHQYYPDYSSFLGHIDEVRVTNGVRYTENFQPSIFPIGLTSQYSTLTEFNINSSDNESPVITVPNEGVKRPIFMGQQFNAMALGPVTAADNIDGDLTSSLSVSAVKQWLPGGPQPAPAEEYSQVGSDITITTNPRTWQIEFAVSDAAGNPAPTKHVLVQANTANLQFTNIPPNMSPIPLGQDFEIQINKNQNQEFFNEGGKWQLKIDGQAPLAEHLNLTSNSLVISSAQLPVGAHTLRVEFVLNGAVYNNSGSQVIDSDFASNVLRMRFEGGDGTFDDTGVQNITNTNVTLSDDVAPGQGGKSAYFNDNNSVLSVPDNSDWDLASSDFTVEAWVKIEDWSANYAGHSYRPIMQIGSNSDWNAGSLVLLPIKLNNEPTAKLRLYHGQGGVMKFDNYSAGDAIQAGVWHHVAMVRDGTVIRAYVDGLLTNEVTGVDYAINLSGSDGVMIGGISDGSGGNLCMKGLIDDLRFSKVVRYPAPFNGNRPEYTLPNTGSNVWQTWRETSVTVEEPAPGPDITAGLVAYYPFDGSYDDASGNGHHGTNSGMSPVAGKLGGGVYSAGDKHISITDPNFPGENQAHPDFFFTSGDFSFGGWVKRTSAGLGTDEWFMAHGDASTATTPYGLHFLVGSNIISVRTYIGNTMHDTQGPAIADENWHHVIAVRDTAAGLMRLYVDGSQVATTAVSGNVSNPDPAGSATTYPLMLGSLPFHLDGTGGHTGASINGTLDEFAFWSRAVSPEEVGALWNGGDGKKISDFQGPAIQLEYAVAGLSAGDKVMVFTDGELLPPVFGQQTVYTIGNGTITLAQELAGEFSPGTKLTIIKVK